MKKVVLIILLATSGVSCFAQGYVLFGNRELAWPPDRLVRFDPVTVGTDAPNPFGTNGAPLVGLNYVAQLYYGPATATEADLIPVADPPAPFRSASSATPGTWFAGGRTLSGFLPPDTVNLQVRVWDSNYAATWEDYLVVQQGLAGKSEIFSHHLNFNTDPASQNMFNFQGFYVGIPEPSIAALVGLGCLLKWLRRDIHTATPWH